MAGRQPHAAPPILERAGPLLARYDALFCDVWGVVHDGISAYASATDALIRFRASGGTVILVSNAPVPPHRVAAMLDARRVERSAWDAIVSSGEIALAHIAKQGYQSVFCIGPEDRDAAFFWASTARPVLLQEAEAVVCTGLNDDQTETAEDYRDVLTRARVRDLEFVCANPDLVVDVGGKLYLCAGALADLYQSLGGRVFWAGKPYPIAYETAERAAERIRGAPIDRRRILVIGDSLRTDMIGAATAGLDALFIAGGIHREELVGEAGIVREKLDQMFADGGGRAIAVMRHLAW